MSEPNNKNAPAFPADADLKSVYRGLTKREYFAAMAMQGLLANPTFSNRPDHEIAEASFTQADAVFEFLAVEAEESKPHTETPTHAPAPMSPGTVNYPPLKISDPEPWWEYTDEAGNKRTYNRGQPVLEDRHAKWVNNGGEFRTYLQPSASLDPL